MPTINDTQLAADLARDAGNVLLDVRTQDLTGKALKDAGDRASQEFLAAALARHRPNDAVLSEEATDDKARVDADRVWIIDPLDGTREFSEPPRDDWAVHVALWEHGELVAGAVARPAAGVVHSTDEPRGATPQAHGRIRLAVSRTRPPEFVSRLAERIDAELVPMGSAGVKAMSVVGGTCDGYVHAGGQYEWDSAAPVAVARAAGLHTSRLDGSPLVYNQPNPWLPDLIICRAEALATIRDGLARL